ncbi:MAG: AsmA family protein [Desulfomicrobium sp.]|nr:AsmA family protein [Pseudomonadota bacterium]MBV1713845.1 AsmA family protein [Desulfomicrobium sp.]MBU4572380.1 AsmA family protein [Pseudomonadota bacterium]MBU4594360.1 AsmA family protein [Pseudomonadota bacterium]MBV1719527.1 AsmA family protein [Desulfomicrobium sp.]
MNVRIWIVRVLLALALLCVGLAGTLLLIVDPNDFKPQIVQAVRDNTGRELTISGDLGLEFFPYLSVSIGEIELGNSEGFTGPFLTLTGAHLKARLLPLLFSRLDVVAIDIEGLSLYLSRDAEGRGNWMDLAAPAAPDSGSDDVPVLVRDRRVPVLASLIVDGLEISEARIVWDDRRSGESFEISGIRLDVSDFAFGEPFVVDTHAMATRGGITGELDFTAKAVLEMDRLTVENLAMEAVLSGASLPSSPETVSLSLDFFSTDGRIDNGRMQGLGLDVRFSANAGTGSETRGGLDVARFNPKDVFARLGLAFPAFTDPSALEQVAFSCAWTAVGDRIDVSDLLLAVDDSALKGKVVVLGRTNPHVTLDLHLDTLDLGRYTPMSQSSEKQSTEAASTKTKEMPLTALRALNLNATLAVDAMTVSKVQVSDTSLRLTAKEGVIALEEIKTSLYDGRLSGSASMDVRGQTPRYSWSHAILGVQVGPLLRDLHGQDSLSGTMESSASVTSLGQSSMDLRRNLNGKVDFKVEDGAIHGMNITQLLRDGIRKVKGQAPGPEEPPRTVFSLLSASGNIISGVETTPDLLLLAPRFRITGSGQTDLVREVLDFSLLIALEGTQGQFEEATLGLRGVPVRVSGPVREPTFSPDMTAVLQGLGLRGGQAVQDVLRGVGSGVNKGVEGLKNLFK